MLYVTCRNRRDQGWARIGRGPKPASQSPVERLDRLPVLPGLPKSEVIAFASASLFFKTFQIHRAIDADKNVLVYTVVSTKLINGSPFNSISVVPAGIR